MITVKIHDLYKMVREIRAARFKYVELTVLDGDEDEPKSLNFTALNEDGEACDFEEIDEFIPK